MRNEEPSADLAPDPGIGAALRAAEGEPPLAEVDWEALRASVRARAAMPLARLREAAAARRSRAWARRPLVPLALAAGVALALWLVPGGDAPPAAPETALGGEIRAEEAFHADLTEQEFRTLVSGRADAESLLLLAVDGG